MRHISNIEALIDGVFHTQKINVTCPVEVGNSFRFTQGQRGYTFDHDSGSIEWLNKIIKLNELLSEMREEAEQTVLLYDSPLYEDIMSAFDTLTTYFDPKKWNPGILPKQGRPSPFQRPATELYKFLYPEHLKVKNRVYLIIIDVFDQMKFPFTNQDGNLIEDIEDKIPVIKALIRRGLKN